MGSQDLDNLEKGPIHFRERFLAFTPADTTAYVKLLMQAFPTLRFYDQWNGGETHYTRPAPPATRWLDAETITKVDTARVIFDPDWEPRWRKEPGETGNWKYTRSPRPSGYFSISKFYDADARGPQHIGESRVDIGYIPGNKEQAAIAGKAMRLVGKVAVNRYQAISWPSYDVLTRIEKGGIFWIGHDAARWARESPDRLL